MEFKEFIKPELLILIPVLYLLGAGIKRMTIPDKWIPLILGGAGVLLSCLYILAAESVAGNVWTAVFVALTQGILAAGASVYVNQMMKQARKQDEAARRVEDGGAQ